MSDGQRRDEMANDLGAKGWKSQGRPAVASAAIVHARTGTTGWMGNSLGCTAPPHRLHAATRYGTRHMPLPLHMLLLNLLGSCVDGTDHACIIQPCPYSSLVCWDGWMDPAGSGAMHAE
jgi:hypothetical protein